jgi:hypothetical protein
MTTNSQSYTATIEIAKPPHHVFECILDVSKWWGGTEAESATCKPGRAIRPTMASDGSHFYRSGSSSLCARSWWNKRSRWAIEVMLPPEQGSKARA